MKKIKLSIEKLKLNKEKITGLSNDQMQQVNGGEVMSYSCVTDPSQAGQGFCSGCQRCGAVITSGCATA